MQITEITRTVPGFVGLLQAFSLQQYRNTISEGVPEILARLPKYVLTVGILAVLLAVGILLIRIRILSCETPQQKQNRKLRRIMASHKPIRAEDFLEQWIIEEHRDERTCSGYRYCDRPGCYVMEIYSGRLAYTLGKRSEAYVGQSLHVCHRVHGHLSGKGNGDVYADARDGCVITIRFYPVGKKRLNDLEKKLIARYHATESYNRTVGGGKKR